jgi:hypothetical protein
MLTITDATRIATTKRVREAIKNTPIEYWTKCLAMRAGRGGGSSGSTFPGVHPSGLDWTLKNIEWEEYSHPAVKSPAACFRAAMPGRMGIVALSTLPRGTQIRLEDPKSTGTFEGRIVHSPQDKEPYDVQEVEFTVIILGPNGNKEGVYTFHPGDPIPPSQITKALLQKHKFLGQSTADTLATVTVVEAIELGLEWVKI